MLPNLIFNTDAKTNIVNVSEKVTEAKTIDNSTTNDTTDPAILSNVNINTLTITLDNPSSYVLLSGVVNTEITQATAVSNEKVSLTISRMVNGAETAIYSTEFEPNAVNEFSHQFSFEWVDKNIYTTHCKVVCPNTTSSTSLTQITYTFSLSVSGTQNTNTTTATMPINSYYSLTAMEVPQ